MHIFKNPHYDFIRWKWQAIGLSWVLILIGVFIIWTKGMPKGVEFSGGTSSSSSSNSRRISIGSATALPGGGANAVVQSTATRRAPVLIRVTRPAPKRRGPEYDRRRRGRRAEQAGMGPIAGTCSRKPATASRAANRRPDRRRELQQRGILATVFALAGILVYIAFRFRFSFAVGAVVATIHDLLITLAFLAIFSYEFSLNVIAALLTITGYSMNDTIVIFDRVRENMRSMRRDNIATVVNAAVNQMLGPDDDHRRPDAAVGDRAVLLRRRSAARASPSR